MTDWADPEQVRAYRRAYREAHRDELIAYGRAYYAAHRDEINAQSRAARLARWVAEDPESARHAVEAIERAIEVL